MGKKIQCLGIAAVCLALWIGWLAGHGRREPTPATAGRTGPVLAPGVSSPAPDVPPPSDEAATPTAPAAPASPAHEASADAFRRWLGAQPEPLDPARLPEGRSLLEARRAAMVWLVRNDPRHALEQALSFAERERLPAEWTPLIEERFSTLADLSLLPDCSPGSTGTVRIFLERRGQPGLRGLAWGELAGHQSKNRLPVEGIALEGWTALQENGVKIVRGREQEAVERLFPPAPAAEVVKNVEATALIGGQVHRFATVEAAGEMANLYARVAALPGPRSASPLTAALSESGAPIPDQIFARAQELASSWTETSKSVLVLNTVFPDRTTPVGTQSEWQAVMNEVSGWMSGVSFGKTSLVATVPPNVFTLPSPVSFYEPAEKYDQIMTDARALALAAGFNPANYDITVVAFPNLAWAWAGRAGGSNQWLNGNRSAGVIAHEFGHNYGLAHASSWDVNDGSIMPATGAPGATDSRHIEYGDRFSVMGSSGSFTDGDFSPHGKAALNWITPAQIQTVSAPGTYRIYRFDAATANANPKLALKLQRAGSQTFWLGYRRRFASNTYLKNGAYVLWEYTPSQCRLLDMTPDSRTASSYDDKEDAALAIGRTFADPTGYLYVTPTAQGGTAPNEWLDVRVEFTIAGNHPPTASINLPAQPVAARTTVALSATATDQDNDALIYSWDFGNGQTASGTTVNWTFYAGGSRQITLRVTDGKGGLAEVTQTIVVSDPLAQIEEISLPDSSQQVADAAWLGGLQVGSNYNYTYVSANGTDWYRTPGTLNFSPKRFASGAGRVVTVGSIYDNSLSKRLAASAVTSDGSVWTKPSHGTTPELNSVAFRNGLFVAVGAAGTLLTSPDGVAWTPRTNPSTSTLNDVTTNATGFLACGQDGTIIHSPDGTTWTQRTTPENWPYLQEIAASGAKAVTVSGNDAYWISQDSGTTWESRSFNLGSFTPDGIAYGEGVWVASDSTYVSASSSYELSLAVSTDGLRWDLLPTRPMPPPSHIRLMDGRMWIYGQTGNILRSALINAGNRPPTLTLNLPALPVAARTSVALSASANDPDNDALSYSWHLGNGQTASGPAVNWAFNAGGSRQITLSVTDGKGGLAEVTQTIVVSDPLAQIEEISLPDSSEQVRDAGWLGGLQVGSSYNYTYASADGALWRRTPGTLNFSPKRFASGAGRVVTVGSIYDNSLSKRLAASAVTSDGSVWTKPSHGTTPELNSVAFRNGLFVAVGAAGTLLTSPDGAAWTPRTNPSTSTLYGVATNGTDFLACGQGGTIITSPDGTTWTQRTTPQNWPYLEEIAASGAKAVTVSGNDTYWISQDSGTTWESRSFNLGSFAPDGIAYGEGVWVASDSTYLSASSAYELSLAVSTDGLRWDLLAPRPLTSSSQVRLMDGRLWIYGQTGKILRSALINAGNRPPTLAPAWPATMTARVAASLSATAGDADGDATEILWEVPGPPYRFGSPVSQTFLFGGTKTLTAWAADARGGHTPSTRTYELDDPLLYWSNITPTTFSGTAMTAAACSSARAVIAGGYASADAPPATDTSRTAWTKRTLPIYGYDLSWRSPGFVAVGQSYDSATSSWRSAVSRSTDGQTWGAIQNLAGTSLRGVAAADTAYVAVGSGGGIFRSTDGLAWNAATSGVTTDLYDVAFAGARGLAVGNNKVLRSEDAGATWTDITSTSGSATYASRVFSAGGRLYLTGLSGQLRIYQPDTRAWLDASISGIASFGYLQSIVLRGSTWVALGLLYDSALARNHRYLAASLDGITWEAGEMPWPADPGSLLDCGGNLLVTGSNMLLANVQGTPGLALTPTSLTTSRGSGETGLLGTLQIGNTGAGSLNWTVSSNAAWLAATPASGTATVSGATISVTLVSARPAGTHTGTLTFSAPGVTSQQVTVTVNAFVDDHGSTQASATRLTPGTAMAGNIQAADDSDWFTFDFTAPGTLKVWTTGSLDTLGELHGATDLLASNDDFNGGSNFQIERVVLPGRHWVKVDGYNTNTGAYQLQSLFTAAGPPFKMKAWGLAPGGTQRRFTVATAIGYRYHVQKSTSLDTGWTQVGSTITATAEEAILTIPLETATRRVYFRIAVQAP